MIYNDDNRPIPVKAPRHRNGRRSWSDKMFSSQYDSHWPNLSMVIGNKFSDVNKKKNKAWDVKLTINVGDSDLFCVLSLIYLSYRLCTSCGNSAQCICALLDQILAPQNFYARLLLSLWINLLFADPAENLLDLIRPTRYWCIAERISQRQISSNIWYCLNAKFPSYCMAFLHCFSPYHLELIFFPIK